MWLYICVCLCVYVCVCAEVVGLFLAIDTLARVIHDNIQSTL